jgi:hypothetical protein
MKPKLFAAAAVLAFSLTGCAARVANVTGLPPGVTAQQAINYDAAIGDLHKIAEVTSTLRQSIIVLRADGLFTDGAAFGKALQALAKIDQAQLAASAYLRDAPEYFADTQKQKIADILGSVTQEIQALNTAGATGIKDPNSLNQVNNLITELTGIVKLVLAL